MKLFSVNVVVLVVRVFATGANVQRAAAECPRAEPAAARRSAPRTDAQPRTQAAREKTPAHEM